MITLMIGMAVGGIIGYQAGRYDTLKETHLSMKKRLQFSLDKLHKINRKVDSDVGRPQ